MSQQTIPETIPAALGVPEGYRKNASGHLVPLAQIKEQDLLRDEVVVRLAGRALALNKALAEFKRDALAEIDDLVRICGDRYGAQLGGPKGNVQAASFDGGFKLIRSTAERIAFTEEIEAAKALINNCIIRWSEGADDKIRVLVDRAFRTDSKGQIKTSAVLELLRLEIQDDEWKRAMTAIRDSIQNTGTAVYVRVYQRNEKTGAYDAIVLDLAAV